MLVTKITDYLNDFDSQTESGKRSVVIDGKWGCGKTYNIDKFLSGEGKKDHIKPNSIYISLFGVKTTSEIVLKLASKLESKFINNTNGNYSIARSSSIKPYNKCIVIFDDLERKDPELSFDSVFGIIDSLRTLGFKVVCITNSEAIDDKDNYYMFAEKTFDSMVHVSADPSVFREVIPGFDFEIDNSYLDRAEENWRQLIKARNECVEIVSFMKNEEKTDFLLKMELDYASFFRSVLLAIHCIFSKNYKEIQFPKEKSFEKMLYELDVKEYGRNVANELRYLFSNEGGENRTLKPIVEALIKGITEHDYRRIIDEYYIEEHQGILTEEPFCHELFYLNDKGKEEFKNSFISRLQEFDFSEDKQNHFLVHNIGQLIGILSDEETQKLINRIIDTVSLEDDEDFIRHLFVFNETKSKKLASFASALQRRFAEKSETSRKNALEKAFEEKDYNYLTSFLYHNKHKDLSEKTPIAELLVSHRFSLPDLSDSLNGDAWSYCHEVARFIAGMKDYEKSFISVLEDQCKKSSSKSLRERCWALVKYNFSEEIDFFERFPLTELK